MLARPNVTDRIKVPMEKIEEFCRKHGVEEFSLFGSVLRNDFGPDRRSGPRIQRFPGLRSWPSAIVWHTSTTQSRMNSSGTWRLFMCQS